METKDYESQTEQPLSEHEFMTDLEHTFFINEPSQFNVRHTNAVSPAVKHLVDTYDLDFFDVDGTGPQGRVLKGDVLAFMAELNINDDRLDQKEIGNFH